MKKILVLVALLSFCVCLSSGCCNNNSPVVPDTPNNPTTPDTPTVGDESTYLTLRDDGGDSILEIYVTKLPIDEVTYSWIEAGTGEYSSSGYFLSNTRIDDFAYATRWSDGTVTFSLSPYGDINYISTGVTDVQPHTDYNDTTFIGYTDDASGSDPDVWYEGNAPDGHTKSDYTFDSAQKKYVYNGGTTGNTLQQLANSLGSSANVEPDDDEDINEDINENDGINTNQLR
jgi:hypothetical protein